jgi:cytochrome c-type biogenesis protein CcmH
VTGGARLGATLVAVAALILTIPAQPSGAESRPNLPDIEDEVMCTICGTLLAESDSPQADRERALIRRLIDQGKTKGEIKDALVAEYGSEVLATPGDDGFDLVAWVVPGLAIAVGAAGILLVALRRARRPSPTSPTPSLEGQDASRLDEDMSRYDL